MASIDQIRMGLVAFYDKEIRPTLPQTKGIIYGAAVGIAMAKPERMLAKIMPAAQMLGIIDEAGNVDIDTMAREIKKQMAANGGEIRMEVGLNALNPADHDVFRFTAQDIDRLIDYIGR
jgi:hypothetical protein